MRSFLNAVLKYPRGLRARLLLYVMLPVALLILAAGGAGYLHARATLMDTWREGAIAWLQLQAGRIDQRLRQPRQILSVLKEIDVTSLDTDGRDLLIKQLRALPAVVAVSADWPVPKGAWMGGMGKAPAGGDWDDGYSFGWDMMRRRQREQLKVSLPRYNPALGGETVSFASVFTNAKGEHEGGIKVTMSFSALTQGIGDSSLTVLLVDDSGHILTSSRTRAGEKKDAALPLLGEGGSGIERATLAALKVKTKGTVIPNTYVPAEISGFYQLDQAPWSLVVIAPGAEVLRPILEFRTYALVLGAAALVVILLLIFLVSGRTVSVVRQVAAAAREVAAGDFDVSLPRLTGTCSREIVDLARNFEVMVRELEAGVRVRQGLRLAQEVQRNFLPAGPLALEGGGEAAGICRYCDETGGDFYDFLTPAGGGTWVVVGDVVGHGVGAALLMATCRAQIRALCSQGLPPAAAITELNRLLCHDTRISGSFITLFLLAVAADGGVSWVRAGHDPALLYDAAAGEVVELKGSGMAIGVEAEIDYEEQRHPGGGPCTVLIGTDGMYEARSPAGEMFGRRRPAEFLGRHHALDAGALAARIMAGVEEFLGGAALDDDITLVVVKSGPHRQGDRQ